MNLRELPTKYNAGQLSIVVVAGMEGALPAMIAGRIAETLRKDNAPSA